MFDCDGDFKIPSDPFLSYEEIIIGQCIILIIQFEWITYQMWLFSENILNMLVSQFNSTICLCMRIPLRLELQINMTNVI